MRAEGKEEGFKECLKKDFKEGSEIDKKEFDILIIKSMLNKGIDYRTISNVTNKRIEEIEEIENNM